MRKTILITMAALASQLFAGGCEGEAGGGGVGRGGVGGMGALGGGGLAGGVGRAGGTPEANPEAKKANAVLVFRADGCHDAEKAAVAATATGVVNGKRQSI